MESDKQERNRSEVEIQTSVYNTTAVCGHLKSLRASSYEAGQPRWLGFRELASPLFPRKIFDVLIMAGLAFTEISVFAMEVSVIGMEIFPYEHFCPG